MCSILCIIYIYMYRSDIVGSYVRITVRNTCHKYVLKYATIFVKMFSTLLGEQHRVKVGP